MANVTLERGLKRLLGLCPEITLDPRAIQLIIDGKTSQVISEHRGNWVEPVPENDQDNEPEVEHECDDNCEIHGEDTDVESASATENIAFTDDGTSDEKSFAEYFDGKNK